MKRIPSVIMLTVMFTGQIASAVFVAPSGEQIAGAAESPVNVVALLKDASPAQAATVMKDVVIDILKLGLPPVDRNARIAEMVRHAFRTMPGQAKALAAALGAAIASSPAASGDADVVSIIQQAVVTTAGDSASASGAAFGNAYNLAMQTVSGAPGGGKMVPPTPPPPPVALPYAGQALP